MHKVLGMVAALLAVIFVLVPSAVCQSTAIVGGPSNTPLPPQPVLYNGLCRLCQIDCYSFIPSTFSSCTYRYYRYGCDARFFCLDTDELRTNERYVAVTYCLMESGCKLNSWVNSIQSLESSLGIPYYLSFTQYAMTSPNTINPQWLSFLARKNAVFASKMYNVIKMYPRDNPDDKAMRLSLLRPLLLAYIHPGPGPLIRFKQALDIYDIRNDRNQVINYVNRWATTLPQWMISSIYPITSIEMASSVMADTDWHLKPLDQYLSHYTPEFVYYSFGLQKLQQFEATWSSNYRIYKECSFWGPNMQIYCSSFNFNIPCDYSTMKRFCQSKLNTLDIDWMADDSRIFLETVYLNKQLSQSFHSAARRQELKDHETDLRNQFSQSTAIYQATQQQLPYYLIPATPDP